MKRTRRRSFEQRRRRKRARRAIDFRRQDRDSPKNQAWSELDHHSVENEAPSNQGGMEPAPYLSSRDRKRRCRGIANEFAVSEALQELKAEPNSGVYDYVHTGRIDKARDHLGIDFSVKLKPISVQDRMGNWVEVGGWLTFDFQVKRSGGEMRLKRHYQMHPTVFAFAVNRMPKRELKDYIRDLIRRVLTGEPLKAPSYWG